MKEVLRTVLLLLIQCIEPIRVSLPLAGKTALQLLAHWTLAEELERSRSVWPVPSLQGSEPCALLPTPTLHQSTIDASPVDRPVSIGSAHVARDTAHRGEMRAAGEWCVRR